MEYRNITIIEHFRLWSSPLMWGRGGGLRNWKENLLFIILTHKISQQKSMLLWLKTWYIGSAQTLELWNTSLQISDFRFNLSSQQAPIYIIFKHELFHLHSNLQLPRLNSISSPACAVKIQSSSLAQYPVRTLSSMILWRKK